MVRDANKLWEQTERQHKQEKDTLQKQNKRGRERLGGGGEQSTVPWRCMFNLLVSASFVSL